MKLSTSLVSVKRISSKIPRSSFPNEDLEKAAQFILDAEGIINPVILKETSFNIYEVVGGDFEYYAAARAREIDPKKGEMVEAYILNEENKKGIIEQIELLRSSKNILSDITPARSTEAPDRIDNLEGRLESTLKEIKQEIKYGYKEQQKYIENRFDEFSGKMPKRIEPLDYFNNASLNNLVDRLIGSGFQQAKAIKVAESIDKERKKNKFESLTNIIQRVMILTKRGKQRGITEKGMIKILDSWPGTLIE